MKRLVASWFGSGLLLGVFRDGDHRGSGTLAAAVTFPVAWWLNSFGWWAVAVAALATTLLSVWAAAPFAEAGADPGWVVVDEAAGTFVAAIGLGGVPLIVAWAVFRIADITKKLPGVARAEALHGGVGITADDVVAGAWGLAAGWLLTLV